MLLLVDEHLHETNSNNSNNNSDDIIIKSTDKENSHNNNNSNHNNNNNISDIIIKHDNENNNEENYFYKSHDIIKDNNNNNEINNSSNNNLENSGESSGESLLSTGGDVDGEEINTVIEEEKQQQLENKKNNNSNNTDIEIIQNKFSTSMPNCKSPILDTETLSDENNVNDGSFKFRSTSFQDNLYLNILKEKTTIINNNYNEEEKEEKEQQKEEEVVVDIQNKINDETNNNNVNNNIKQNNNDNDDIMEIPILTITSSSSPSIPPPSNTNTQSFPQSPYTLPSSPRSVSVPLIRARVQRTPSTRSRGAFERPLLHAVLLQEEIKNLISYDDVNTRDLDGNSILHRVSIIGNSVAIKHIILRGGRVNAVNNIGLTPLHYAACANVPSVDVLLYYGSQANAKDNNFETPLHYAADRGQLSIVSILLSRGCKVGLANKSMGRNPIHLAAIKGYSQILRSLLEYKSNVNSMDKSGCTPLHLSVFFSPILNNNSGSNTSNNANGKNGILYNSQEINSCIDQYLSCCEILLQRGCNIFAQDTDGSTALHLASSHGKKNFIEVILFYANKCKSPSLSSIANGKSIIAMNKGENKSELALFIPDNKGRLPLHIAAIAGHSKSLPLLIGANKKAAFIRDEMGMTALCLASLFGHFDCVQVLSREKRPFNFQFKFFNNTSDIKTPFDPLGNDFKLMLDGQYCDVVFIVEGREIYAHTVILRQFKVFREMINQFKLPLIGGGSIYGGASNNGASASYQLPIHHNGVTNTHNTLQPQQHYQQYLSSFPGNSIASDYYNNIENGGSFNEDDDDNSSIVGNGGGIRNLNVSGGRTTRSRMGSVLNPNGLTRIPIEKSVSYDMLKAVLHYTYTSEVPRELLSNSNKFSEFSDLCTIYNIDSIVDVSASRPRYGTLDMASYLYRQVGSSIAADVMFICEGGSHAINAHSVILASRSNWFKSHFESQTTTPSKSIISIFPTSVSNLINTTTTTTTTTTANTSSSNSNNINNVIGSNSLTSSGFGFGGGHIENTPRKYSCPSSPGLGSEIGLSYIWTIDVCDINHKVLTALLEYLYCGSIVYANPYQPSSSTVSNTLGSGVFSPSEVFKFRNSGNEQLDVLDILSLAKLANTIQLSILQQYCGVLLFHILDVPKIIVVIKSIFELNTLQFKNQWLNNGSNSNSTTTSTTTTNGNSTHLSAVEEMWSVCLIWLFKKCNWLDLVKNDTFTKQFSPKFIKDLKKEKDEKKKKTEKLERQKKKKENSEYKKQQQQLLLLAQQVQQVQQSHAQIQQLQQMQQPINHSNYGGSSLNLSYSGNQQHCHLYHNSQLQQHAQAQQAQQVNPVKNNMNSVITNHTFNRSATTPQLNTPSFSSSPSASSDSGRLLTASANAATTTTSDIGASPLFSNSVSNSQPISSPNPSSNKVGDENNGENTNEDNENDENSNIYGEEDEFDNDTNNVVAESNNGEVNNNNIENDNSSSGGSSNNNSPVLNNINTNNLNRKPKKSGFRLFSKKLFKS